MELNAKQMETIAQKGIPFLKNGTIIKFNEHLLAELFNQTGKFLYIANTAALKMYFPETGCWKDLETNKVLEMINLFIYQLGCYYGFSEIGFYITYDKIRSIFNTFCGIAHRNSMPVCDKLFIHTKDNVLVFDKENASMQIVPHSPDFYSTNMVDYSYVPEAKCPKFLERLLTPMLVCKDCLTTLQLYFAQCLLKKNLAQKFVILSGDAECGKSVLVSVFEFILGLDNVAELHPERLTEKFEMVNYYDKSLLVAKDVPFDALSANKVENLKKMTGGDLQSIEFKHSNTALKCRGNFNIIITGNSHITLDFGEDRAAFERRLLYIPCRKSPDFQRIENFEDVLIEEEAEGILAWIVEGVIKLLEAKCQIKGSESQLILNKVLMDESEAVTCFVRECIEETFLPVTVTTNEAINAYYRYAQHCNWRNYPENETKIQRQLRKAMNHFHSKCMPSCNCIDQITQKRCNGYRNCRIKDF